MKTTIMYILALALLTVAGAANPLSAQTKKAKTITGDLVDLVTFVTTAGKENVDMIQKSAKAGNPLGLYDTKAKKLYLIGSTDIGKSVTETVLPYVGVRVFVTGKVYTKAGMNIILLSQIGKSIK